MQQATHIYSGSKGNIIGHHNQKKAHLIQLPTGQHQYWSDASVMKMGDDTMTDQIIIKLSYEKNKNFNVIERYFEKPEDAAQYLNELQTLNTLSDFTKGGSHAVLSNGWHISSNTNLKAMLSKKPSEPSFDLKKTLSRPVKVKSSASPDSLNTPLKNRSFNNGRIVKLQNLTSDTRKARVILRTLVRDKKIAKPGRWEWEEGSKDLAVVKAALGKS